MVYIGTSFARRVGYEEWREISAVGFDGPVECGVYGLQEALAGRGNAQREGGSTDGATLSRYSVLAS